jgi:hypothetical protein
LTESRCGGRVVLPTPEPGGRRLLGSAVLAPTHIRIHSDTVRICRPARPSRVRAGAESATPAHQIPGTWPCALTLTRPYCLVAQGKHAHDASGARPRVGGRSPAWIGASGGARAVPTFCRGSRFRVLLRFNRPLTAGASHAEGWSATCGAHIRAINRRTT